MNQHSPLQVYNTLTRKKEPFEPINPPFVGMYVCGPTVYGDAHLGHARSAITFDVVYRYLRYIGYKVRYVRNITDVGHLENDADSGEDKIAKKAKLEQLEPMEVAQQFTNQYREDMRALHVKEPGIEPLATGHIPEQIALIEKILENGLAYVTNGSVYFDVKKYAEKEQYGALSGRVLDDLITQTRELDGQEEKRYGFDFALWKQAGPEHIMRWKSPWGEGFPGWHIECSAMSTKYLGEVFDIHGGGMDLLFPHHECEVAQSKAGNGKAPARYWLHNNMVTINGQKMGKSLGNFITLKELFSGNHPLLDQAYSPMTIRFFILQAQYRSTLDFSNEALKAARKGYVSLLNAYKIFNYIPEDRLHFLEKDTESSLSAQLAIEPINKCVEALSDDFNTARAIASLFDMTKFAWYLVIYNSDYLVSKNDYLVAKKFFTEIFQDVLGLTDENTAPFRQWADDYLVEYRTAKENKNYEKVDKIRAVYNHHGLSINDYKGDVYWFYK